MGRYTTGYERWQWNGAALPLEFSAACILYKGTTHLYIWQEQRSYSEFNTCGCRSVKGRNAGDHKGAAGADDAGNPAAYYAVASRCAQSRYQPQKVRQR